MKHLHSLLEFYWNIRRRDELDELDEYHTIGKKEQYSLIRGYVFSL